MKLGHAVGFRPLESDYRNKIAFKGACPESLFQAGLILEADRRRFDDFAVLRHA
jgi:hypothetical protein